MHHILIIEDAPNFRHYLAGLLMRAFPNAQVTSATTIKAASAELARQRPDLVILDLALPADEDDAIPRAEAGLSLLEQLKATAEAPRVVVMTSQHELETECRSKGADSFVSKSRKASDLGAQLLSVIRSLAESVA